MSNSYNGIKKIGMCFTHIHGRSGDGSSGSGGTSGGTSGGSGDDNYIMFTIDDNGGGETTTSGSGSSDGTSDGGSTGGFAGMNVSPQRWKNFMGISSLHGAGCAGCGTGGGGK